MKYNKDSIYSTAYSTANNLEITVSQTGSKAMIREQGQDKAIMRQGYRVLASGECICMGEWHEKEKDVLLKAIKYERYAHLAYRELYHDLINKLASIGLVIKENENDDIF